MVRDICYSTIFTEVMRRGKIRKAHALERIFARFAFAHVGEAISVSGKGLKSETDAVRCERLTAISPSWKALISLTAARDTICRQKSR